jgi:hypothetical protein
MGIVFSTLKHALDPEEPAPDDSKDWTENLLAQARRFLLVKNEFHKASGAAHRRHQPWR